MRPYLFSVIFFPPNQAGYFPVYELNVLCFLNETNISFQYARWSEITRRIFESGACGCCILANKIPAEKMLGKIFTHNESIILYTNIFSLIKQIFLILKDKKKIKRISQNSYHIIKTNHTVEKRVEKLIEIVNNYQSK